MSIRSASTGSSFTGQEIVRAAAGNLKRLSLELGGKSPDVIFADANLDAAVPGAAMGVFANSGQVCCAGTRVFVERPVYEEFVSRVSRSADSLKVGNSLDPTTQIGPIVSAQLDRVTGYLDIGKAEGARTTAGGARLQEGELANGYFVPPTVFADVHDDMRIAREEIFGPVASVMPFDDIDEVIRPARTSPSSVSVAASGPRDVGKAHRLAASINTGVVWVNTYNLHDPAMPFGGLR